MWSPYVIPCLPTFAIHKLGQAVRSSWGEKGSMQARLASERRWEEEEKRGACRHGSSVKGGERRRGRALI